jgi:hypothetical protein
VARRSSTADPFGVLGLPATAGSEDLRLARRRLALAEHPDRGGSADRMQAINVAYEEAMELVVARELRGPIAGDRAPAATRPSPPSSAPPEPPADSPESEPRPGGRPRVERDDPSFVIEALPAEAFEALLVVASWIGEVLVDEPPYLLEVHLYEPGECWCRLELLPEAGASTVMLTVAGLEGVAPPVEDVRDLWVANLNALGRDPDATT